MRGRAALIGCFTNLLAANPDWARTHGGSIPEGERSIEVDGVCTLQLRDGLIDSNQLRFDPTDPIAALVAKRKSHSR